MRTFRDVDREKGIITIHYLVRFKSTEGEDIDTAKYAKEYQKALSDFFHEQTKDMRYIEDGRNYQIKLNMIILSESDIPELKKPGKKPVFEAAKKLPIDHPDFYEKYIDVNKARKKKFQEELAARRLALAFNNFYEDGDFIHQVKLTKKPLLQNGKEYFNAGTIPVVDPKWNAMSLFDIVAHELLGHGLGNADEYNNAFGKWFDWINATLKKGEDPDKQSFMHGQDPAFKGKLSIRPRHLNPVLYRKNSFPCPENATKATKSMFEDDLKQVHDLNDLKDPIYSKIHEDVRKLQRKLLMGLIKGE